MNEAILNNKLEELKEIVTQMEVVIENLTQNADKQMIVHNRLADWIKLFELDEKVDEILKDILAQFYDGEKVLWRAKMEERHLGIIAKFDKVCDFMEDVSV